MSTDRLSALLSTPTFEKRWTHWLADASVLVALLGLAFVVGGVALWYVALVPTIDSLHHVLFTLVMHVLFGGIVLVFGVHIERSELLPEEKFAVLVWCYAGFTLMFALSVWGHVGSIVSGTLTTAFVSDFVVFTSLGAAFGTISGVNWGRATRNQLLAEQNREQRETLALLTRLLSHDIRNDMAVIEGHADLLGEHVAEEGRSHVTVIQTHIDEADQLLQSANALIKSITEEREFEPVDLSNVLDRELETIRTDHEAVTLEADVPPGLRVEADQLIHQIFSNLFQNAVFHNDVDELTIRTTAEQTDEAVDVTISDTGDGIPPEVRETCFELGEKGPESGGDGIGLYLVSRLVDLYGGTIAVDESPSGGTRFHISFPLPSTQS
jgi:signal transduction histidine kinase